MNGEPQRRVVRGTLRGNTPPPTVELTAYEGVVYSLIASLLKIAIDFRFEIFLLSVVTSIWMAFAQLSLIWAFFFTGLTVFAPLRFPSLRKFVARKLRHGHTRRTFDSAARFAGLATANDHVPTVHSITDTPAGEQLKVRIPPGSAFTYLEEANERIATSMSVREVRITADPTSASLANVSIVRRDPFGNQEIDWPSLNSDDISIWNAIPVGIDEMGTTATVTLPERNLLLGGEPGAGKSVALSQLVATAALDSTCDLSLFDGKRVELACWSKCAIHSVGPWLDDAIDVLKTIRDDMNQRYEILLDAGKRKIEPEMNIRLHTVVCDELAFYLTMGDRKQNQEFATLMRDLVARGRAAGIIVLAATQKPSHDIIPTSLRDLFAFRWALRCTTPQASDTVLGQGWSTEGFSAKEIDAGQRGVGYLLSEGGEPVRIKSFYLSDDHLNSLAAKAAAKRKEARSLRAA